MLMGEVGIDMIIYGAISLLLIAISVYLIWAFIKLKTISKKERAPSKERLIISKDIFLHSLSQGDVKQQEFKKLINSLSMYIHGDKKILYALIIALLSKGHLLIQGTPGTGKTTLVRLFAQLCDFTYARIQSTPDLLPQDVIGSEVFDAQKQTFSVRYGPVVAVGDKMTNLLHIDEINRATPKLQSSFLEVMQEKTVTISDKEKKLEDPFFVVATQNPYDAIGTYMLPYSQIDRFVVGVFTKGLDEKQEYELLQNPEQQSLDTQLPKGKPIFTKQILLDAQSEVDQVVVSEEVMQHLVKCIYAIKEYASVVSTRASKALLVAAKSWAYLQGKNEVGRTDVDAVLDIVLRHRVSYLLGKDVTDEQLYNMLIGSVGKGDIVG